MYGHYVSDLKIITTYIQIKITVLSNTKDRYKNGKGLSEDFYDNGHSAVRMIFQKFIDTIQFIHFYIVLDCGD